MREDLSITLKVYQARKLSLPREDRVALAQTFRGRLFSCFFLSGPFALVGVFMGTVTQYVFHSADIGLNSTLPWIMFLTTLAFQIFWWMHNRRLYLSHYPNRLTAIWALQKDLFRVHITGIAFGTAFASVGFALTKLMIVLIGHFFPKVIDWIPMNVLFFILDFILVQGPYLRVMGELFDKQSKKLSEKYGLEVSLDAA